MSAPTLPVRTERLRLRPYVEGDLARLLETYGDPGVSRYLLEDPWDEAVARERLATRIRRTDYAGEAGGLALVIDVDGDYVGDVVLWPVADQPRTGELGWVMHPAHTGVGYAAEAARAVLQIGFGHYDLHRVVAQLDARNTASARLCERVGMRLEAHHLRDYWSKGEWTDSLVYALLGREWHARE